MPTFITTISGTSILASGILFLYQLILVGINTEGARVGEEIQLLCLPTCTRLSRSLLPLQTMGATEGWRRRIRGCRRGRG